MSINDLKKLKYISIDSSFRDRNFYPNPCNFEIPVSQLGYRDKLNSNDPISDMFPILAFNSAFVVPPSSNDTLGSSEFFTEYSRILIQDEDPNLVFFISILSPSKLKTLKNFYKGSILGCIPQGFTSYEYRRIDYYEYIGQFELLSGKIVDVGKFKIIEPFSSPNLSLPNVSNPSFNNNSLPFSYIFIPNGSEIDNFYNNYLLINEDINENLKILSYNSKTKIATLDGTFSNSWNPYDNYTIRKRLPFESGNISGLNKYLLNAPFLSSNISNFYVGDIIRISDLSSPFYNKTSVITSYDPISKNISIKFPIDDSLLIPSNTKAELLIFTKDNLVPLFSYISGESSNQNIYELELINIVIPNLLLDSNNGGYPKNYPYFYLEIFNSSTYGNTRNTIISNNPNSFRAIFRIPIDDTTNQNISKFLKLNGNGMKQIIKFRPDQSINILLKSPQGNIISFIEKDFFSPNIPNLNIQINICLSIRLIK